jgi:hypothetical protein
MSRTPSREGAAQAPAQPEAAAAFPHVESVLEEMQSHGGTPAVVTQTYGVVEQAGDTLTVRTGGSLVPARRAASCLLEPATGDQVLVAVHAGASFVLAVLVQADRGAPGATLSLDGDLTLRSKKGKVAIVADDDVEMTSGAAIALNAPELHVRTLRTTIFAESLSYIGRKIDTEVDRIKLAARTLEAAIDRVSERVQRSFRKVEEMEQVKAKELDIVVEGTASIHGENALVSADKLVKIDGEQVHLG